MRGVGHDLRQPAHRRHGLAAEQVAHRRRIDRRQRPQRVDGDAVLGELGRHPQRTHRHAELRHRVGDVVLEPFRRHVERRRQRQDVRVRGLLEVRDARLRHQERAARVDLVHQVEPLHVGGERAGQLDGAGVIDADVDAAEPLERLLHRLCDLRLLADVAQHRQRLASRRFDLVRRRVDRARQLRMRLRGLRRDRHVRAVLRSAQRDRQPDPARPARDENRLAFQRHGALPRICPRTS